jgi:hypothetical protein
VSIWTASESLVVVLDGRPVHLEERYLRMVLWVLRLRVRMDGHRSGKLHLSYNGNSVGAGVEECYGPEALAP